jgi:hypothetical protein
MSLKNHLYQEIERQRRIIEQGKLVAKVQAMKEELPTEREMRTWHEGSNPAERQNEIPYPSE